MRIGTYMKGKVSTTAARKIEDYTAEVNNVHHVHIQVNELEGARGLDRRRAAGRRKAGVEAVARVCVARQKTR